MSGGETIRVRGTGCVLIGPEGRTPPLPFITVDEGEGNALIAQKLAALYTGEEPEAEAPAEDEVTEEVAEEVTEEVTENAEEVVEEVTDEVTENDTDTGGEGDDENGGDDPAVERANTIMEALDLVEEAGLVKSGDRKGKPTVKAIEEITGLEDVTADEIDAAIAAKDSAD